jgi:hypothetical protein
MSVRLFVAVVAVWAAGGCARNCVPEPLARPGATVEACAAVEPVPSIDPALLRDVAAEVRRRGTAAHPSGAHPYHVLALSGGGLYGSYGVGVLNGWTESGTRPLFDVVTGISTGAYMAPFAFLGPQYDNVLRQEAVGLQLSDLAKRRSVFVMPFSDSAFDDSRLVASIERLFTTEFLCEVARAHAAGRRLYVGTTNLDTSRLTIWDMGAIAARGTPEAYALFREIIRASGAVPGVLPPGRVTVNIDGQCYEELHVDGGANSGAVFRPFMIAEQNRLRGINSPFAPTGSAVYVVNNRKLFVDTKCVRASIFPELAAGIRGTFYAKTRDEFYRIYQYCLETGTEFRATAIPQALQIGSSDLRLSKADQEKLFDVGTEIGRATPTGRGWWDHPRGLEPEESDVPRTGTNFTSRP